MDTSETYIKMCDCPEIQGSVWIPKEGDIVCYSRKPDEIDNFTPKYSLPHIYTYDDFTFKKDDYGAQNSCGSLIWLPRQDQLQEMVWAAYVTKRPGLRFVIHKKEPFNGILMDVFWKFSCSCVNAVLTPDDYKWSMEQLWLAFDMKELHNKTWDGEKWIN